MVGTIGNPLSWGARSAQRAGHEIADSARHVMGEGDQSVPQVRPIGLADIRAALKAGATDFMHFRTDVIAACLLYPLVGLALIGVAMNRGILPLVFPILSGFAIVGPVAALGLYELSRRRERGETAAWSDMLSVARAPGFGSILVLSCGLICWYFLWLIVAWILHGLTMGTGANMDAWAFLSAVFGTPGGWAMILIGIPVGFVFATAALAVSVLSFPMLIDRGVGLPHAVAASVRLMQASPGPVLAWGAVIVAGLVIGAIPMLLGLAVTLPVLGHATWHLYRRATA
jgi:uncharacterized membrane protein